METCLCSLSNKEEKINKKERVGRYLGRLVSLEMAGDSRLLSGLVPGLSCCCVSPKELGDLKVSELGYAEPQQPFVLSISICQQVH